MQRRGVESAAKRASHAEGPGAPKAPAKAEPRPEDLPDKPFERKKILLVDDSMTALMMNRMLLSKASCDIITARDGREAIQKALAERPDLVIMDIVMPQMNGFEACKELRAHSETKDTPILLVTTRGEAESIATGFASGCTDYITKPVNSVELLAKIKAYLGG
jgi:DNA-binding response OmpR family regulator